MNRKVSFFFLVALLLLTGLLTACNQPQPGAGDQQTKTESMEQVKDPHSFANTAQVVVEDLGLNLNVDFDKKQISGTARLRLANKAKTNELILDTRDLTIQKVELERAGSTERAEARFSLGDEVKFLGRPLKIEISPETQNVIVHYSTSPTAAALQWLEPSQTAGGKKPFLFTQSQAILARTWVPCQDSPGVRMTYQADIKTRPDLLAVMSANNNPQPNPEGIYRFTMPQRIPSYLLALAVGDISFRPLGSRSGVYAEASVVDKAANEFADLEKMMVSAESLYGPYRWERYDVIVLPPSFPFGGMENPRLTFATPTILAGDRSLVSLIAHELAHSWSGNLVTNATWNDFWLNEGFTNYFENRIMEKINGRNYSEMLALLGQQELKSELENLKDKPEDTRLKLDLAGRDADEGTTSIAS
jgi:aminopeptidase N